MSSTFAQSCKSTHTLKAGFFFFLLLLKATPRLNLQWSTRRTRRRTRKKGKNSQSISSVPYRNRTTHTHTHTRSTRSPLDSCVGPPKTTEWLFQDSVITSISLHINLCKSRALRLLPGRRCTAEVPCATQSRRRAK